MNESQFNNPTLPQYLPGYLEDQQNSIGKAAQQTYSAGDTSQADYAKVLAAQKGPTTRKPGQVKIDKVLNGYIVYLGAEQHVALDLTGVSLLLTSHFT